MKILHRITGMLFVFLVSSGTAQPMFKRCIGSLTRSNKFVTSMHGDLLGTKNDSSKKIFLQYFLNSRFHSLIYTQNRWFSDKKGEFLQDDNRVQAVRLLAERFKCSEQEMELRIEKQHEQAIREYINQNIQDINAQDSNGNTLLIQAICAKNFTAFKVLLEMKADPNISDFLGIAPLHLALHFGDIHYLRALLQAGANPNVVHYIDIEEDFFGVWVTRRSGFTPLRIAVCENNVEYVRELLEMGANPEVPTKEYKAHLIAVAQNNGNKEIIDLLEIYPLYGA